MAASSWGLKKCAAADLDARRSSTTTTIRDCFSSENDAHVRGSNSRARRTHPAVVVVPAAELALLLPLRDSNGPERPSLGCCSEDDAAGKP
jgi:hypothetical protein